MPAESEVFCRSDYHYDQLFQEKLKEVGKWFTKRAAVSYILHLPNTSYGVMEQLLHKADEKMYRNKNLKKALLMETN